MKLKIAIILFLIIVAVKLSVEKIDDRAILYQVEPQQVIVSIVEPCEASVELDYKVIPARITCYLETGYNMANGQYPKKGWVATSDRTIPFNTEIEIDGVKYKVGDRTNKRFDRELITVDIYWEDSLESCLKFGVQYRDVKIFNK